MDHEILQVGRTGRRARTSGREHDSLCQGLRLTVEVAAALGHATTFKPRPLRRHPITLKKFSMWMTFFGKCTKVSRESTPDQTWLADAGASIKRFVQF